MLRKAIETRLRKPGEDRSPGDFALSFLECFYGKAAEKRNRAFDQGKGVRKLPVPIVSIGNLVAGGTGKTPMTRAISEILAKEGLRIAILSRGYGGTREKKGGRVSNGKTLFLSARQAGDEPFLLARTTTASVYVGSDRYKSGLCAVEDGADLLLLDDGFQHRQLHRDLDILLMDAGAPLGNGHLLPRGLLRESPLGLNRSDAVIFTRFDNSEKNPLDRIKAFTRSTFREKTRVFFTGESLVWCKDLAPDPGESLFVFSGIADPENFVQTLRKKGFDVKGRRAFPDHYAYDPKSLSEIYQAAKTVKVGALATTAKDAVKIPKDFFRTFRIFVADVRPVFSAKDLFEEWLVKRVVSLLKEKGTERT